MDLHKTEIIKHMNYREELEKAALGRFKPVIYQLVSKEK